MQAIKGRRRGRGGVYKEFEKRVVVGAVFVVVGLNNWNCTIEVDKVCTVTKR